MFETLAEHYKEGGWGMYPITLCLIFIVAIIVERVTFLFFKASIEKDAFVQALRKYILAGNIGKALSLCSQAPTPLSNIIKAGLLKVNKSDAEVQAAMDEAALRELPKIEHRTPYLALLANLAMLSGLFGTVTGLNAAFGAVANADAASRATMLARGISEAMNCTAFGLLAALIALIGFALLNGKTQSLLDDINGATVQVMNLVVNNRSKINLQGVPQA